MGQLVDNRKVIEPMGTAQMMDVNGTIAQRLLGGRDAVAKSVADCLTTSKKELDQEEFSEIMNTCGIDNVDDLIGRLESKQNLSEADVLGIITMLPYIGYELLGDLNIDTNMLESPEIRDAVKSQMNEQQSGPLYPAGGEMKFDEDYCIGVFVRLQAVEDLCE